MTLSYRAQRILRYNIQWPRINVTTLHENDVVRIEKNFKYMIDNDMDYTINEVDAWLNTHFMGVHEDTRQHILEIAKDVKHRLSDIEGSPPTDTETHGI